MFQAYRYLREEVKTFRGKPIMVRDLLTIHIVILAIPKLNRELGRVSNFSKSINWHHHMKNHVEIGHLTKYDAFRVYRDQVMDLEIWFKIYTVKRL